MVGSQPSGCPKNRQHSTRGDQAHLPQANHCGLQLRQKQKTKDVDVPGNFCFTLQFLKTVWRPIDDSQDSPKYASYGVSSSAPNNTSEQDLRIFKNTLFGQWKVLPCLLKLLSCGFCMVFSQFPDFFPQPKTAAPCTAIAPLARPPAPHSSEQAP